VVLLWPVRHHLFDFAGELSEMGGGMLAKLAPGKSHLDRIREERVTPLVQGRMKP
jgi:hypothetical protein